MKCDKQIRETNKFLSYPCQDIEKHMFHLLLKSSEVDFIVVIKKYDYLKGVRDNIRNNIFDINYRRKLKHVRCTIVKNFQKYIYILSMKSDYF